jgi:predicted MFS family arabinose efflux permease
VGSFATAVGAVIAGTIAQLALDGGASQPDAYRLVIVGYAAVGIVIGVLFLRLDARVEIPLPQVHDEPIRTRLGLHRSQRIVAGLSALFALDSFAGGFVIASFVAFWFQDRFGLDPATLGLLLFGTNVLAGISALAAGPLAARFGLIETMVFTHLPSNVLLILVPFMPTVETATIMFLARSAISQMDVPTRQSYTMAVVDPDERSAAAGVTGVARSLGVAASPVLAGPLFLSAALTGLPFVIAGGLKIVYDLLLFRSFRSVRPPEEAHRTR